MQMDLPPGEMLRHAMRHWVTGVTIVTSRLGEQQHGMTVNSFGSVALDPPLVMVTMNNDARTCQLVQESGVFAVTILSMAQEDLANRFAGRGQESHNRMLGLETFTLVTGAPLLTGGSAWLDCKVAYQYALPRATLFLGEVLSVRFGVDSDDAEPLVYFNRAFHQLGFPRKTSDG